MCIHNVEPCSIQLVEPCVQDHITQPLHMWNLASKLTLPSLHVPPEYIYKYCIADSIIGQVIKECQKDFPWINQNMVDYFIKVSNVQQHNKQQSVGSMMRMVKLEVLMMGKNCEDEVVCCMCVCVHYDVW